jgi:phage-related minor tail protein
MGLENKEIVSSEDLEKLQSEINIIAEKIIELRETVGNAISAVGEEWQDTKYEEFSEAYEENKTAMADIATEYQRYANDVLPPFIEKAKEYDAIKVSR